MTTTTLTTRSDLSRVVSELSRVHRSFDEASEREMSWDGGEFSGPAMSAGRERELRATLKRHGWTAVELVSELSTRCSGRGAGSFIALVSDLYVRCEQCGSDVDVVSSTPTKGFDPSTLLRLSCGHVAL